MHTVALYFDFVSPYAWLALTQIDRMERAVPGVQVDVIPVLFYGLLQANGQRGPVDIPAKRNYIIQDVMRWCAQYGIDFQGPPYHPFNPLKALRLTITIADAQQRKAFAIATANACWRDGLDITADDTLFNLLRACQIDPAQMMSHIATAEVKATLKNNTDTAVALGAFGVPTIIANGELFWGHDRIDQVISYLQGTLAATDAARHTHITTKLWAEYDPQKTGLAQR